MLRTQFHKMQNNGKMDLLNKKRKLCDFGQIISLPSVKNCAKIYQGRSSTYTIAIIVTCQLNIGI